MIDFLAPLITGICFLALGRLEPLGWVNTFAIMAGGISCFRAGMEFYNYKNKKNKGENNYDHNKQ